MKVTWTVTPVGYQRIAKTRIRTFRRIQSQFAKESARYLEHL